MLVDATVVATVDATSETTPATVETASDITAAVSSGAISAAVAPSTISCVVKLAALYAVQALPAKEVVPDQTPLTALVRSGVIVVPTQPNAPDNHVGAPDDTNQPEIAGAK